MVPGTPRATLSPWTHRTGWPAVGALCLAFVSSVLRGSVPAILVLLIGPLLQHYCVMERDEPFRERLVFARLMLVVSVRLLMAWLARRSMVLR